MSISLSPSGRFRYSLAARHRERVLWPAVQEFLLTVEESRCVDEFCASVLERLEAVVPFDGGYFFLFDPCGRLSLCRTRHVSEWTKRLYFSYYMNVDPCRERTPVRQTVLHTDWRTFRESEFYRDFGRHEGVLWSARVQLHDAAKRLSGVVFITRATPPDFSDSEMAFLEIVHPHLENLLRILTRLERRGPTRLSDPPPPWISELTPRERQIASMLCKGVRTKEIASRLLIRPSTVYRHVNNLLRKSGAGGRSQLVARLLQSGDPDEGT